MLKKCIDRILINASCLIQCIIINEQSWEYWHDIQNVYNDYKQLNSYQILVTRVNSSYYTIHKGLKNCHNIPFLWHYYCIFDTHFTMILLLLQCVQAKLIPIKPLNHVNHMCLIPWSDWIRSYLIYLTSY